MSVRSISKKKQIPIVIIISLILCVGIVLAAVLTRQSSSKSIDLSLETLRRDDGSFQFRNAKFGQAILDVEDSEGIDFPDIPYYCEEWTTGVLPNHPEQVFDYKHYPDYIGPIEYIGYIHSKPLRVKYGSATGYVGYQFYKGQLVQVNIYFSDGASRRDPNMSFGNVKYDVNEIFDELYADLENTFGTHDTTNEEKYGVNPDQFRWNSDIYDDEGYTTRISLFRQQSNDDTTTVQVIIGRAREIDGAWGWD